MTGISRLDIIRNEVVRARTDVRHTLTFKIAYDCVEMIQPCGEDG